MTTVGKRTTRISSERERRHLARLLEEATRSAVRACGPSHFWPAIVGWLTGEAGISQADFDRWIAEASDGYQCDHIRGLGSNRCIRCRDEVPMSTRTCLDRAASSTTAPSAPGKDGGS